MLRLFNFVLFVVVVFSLASMLPKAAVDPDGASRVLGQSVRVLMTYDAGESTLSANQKTLVDSPSLRTWLDARCLKDGATPAWRIVEAQKKFNDDQPEFKQLMAEPRSNDNWIYVSNDKKTLTSAPLPANEAAAEAQIGKFSK